VGLGVHHETDIHQPRWNAEALPEEIQVDQSARDWIRGRPASEPTYVRKAQPQLNRGHLLKEGQVPEFVAEAASGQAATDLKEQFLRSQ